MVANVNISDSVHAINFVSERSVRMQLFSSVLFQSMTRQEVVEVVLRGILLV